MLGFLWQLVQLEISSRHMSMGSPSLDLYKWVKDYVACYPGLPKEINSPAAFRDGRVVSFMLHKSCPEAVDLAAMEVQTPLLRLSHAIRGAKMSLDVPNLLSAESFLDIHLPEPLLLTYLSAFRSCVEGRTPGDAASAANMSSPLETPSGKHDALRGGAAETARAGVESFHAGPEYENVPCAVCGRNLQDGTPLVKTMPEEMVYHSACFTCRTCQSPFESFFWPFQLIPYCFEHYLRAASFDCAACEGQISEGAVLVHGRKYHSKCWVCSDCHSEFENSYNIFEGKPYCGEHYKIRAGVTCSDCGLALEKSSKSIKAMGGLFHRKCFSCRQCGTPILPEGPDAKPLEFLADGSKVVCLSCHQASLLEGPATICHACNQAITSECVSAMGEIFCIQCFVCSGCGVPFVKNLESGVASGYYNVEGKPYDEECARKL